MEPEKVCLLYSVIISIMDNFFYKQSFALFFCFFVSSSFCSNSTTISAVIPMEVRKIDKMVSLRAVKVVFLNA